MLFLKNSDCSLVLHLLYLLLKKALIPIYKNYLQTILGIYIPSRQVWKIFHIKIEFNCKRYRICNAGTAEQVCQVPVQRIYSNCLV